MRRRVECCEHCDQRECNDHTKGRDLQKCGGTSVSDCRGGKERCDERFHLRSPSFDRNAERPYGACCTVTGLYRENRIGAVSFLTQFSIPIVGREGPPNREAWKQPKSCHRDVTSGAGVQAFINCAEKHPEKWHSPDGWGVNEAVRETWPCRR
jgi:hypothetical protein